MISLIINVRKTQKVNTKFIYFSFIFNMSTKSILVEYFFFFKLAIKRTFVVLNIFIEVI